MKLVPYGDGRVSIPHDWQRAGRVLCISGSVASGYTGWAAIALTPDVLILATPMGIEEIVPLWGIEDVSVVKFEGILIERQTSVGRILSPLPYPYGVEIVYSLETRLRMRMRVATMSANTAHDWAREIRHFTRLTQLDDLSDFSIQKRSPDDDMD